MLSYDEVKNFGKKAGKKQSDREKLLKGSEPAKEAMYKKWQETKVAGGTVNPIISTDSKVKENETLTGRKQPMRNLWQGTEKRRKNTVQLCPQAHRQPKTSRN